jgi:centromeric protein E
MKTKNCEVFNTVAKPIIESSVGGIHGTIFAYGQTSSGKYFYVCVLHPVV